MQIPFQRYFNQDLFPVLLSGSDINSNIRLDNIIRVVNDKIGKQYSSISISATLENQTTTDLY